MSFRDSEISYKMGNVTIYHDNWDDCKDLPWKVKAVVCLPHPGSPYPHPLDEEKWEISEYARTETGYSARLTVLPLDLSKARDLHLYQQFQGSGKLKLLIKFNSPTSGYLNLNLKP